MKGDDIADRLVELAARVINVVDALPQKMTGKHIADQLLRSGASPGAHYEEARGAESRRDFVHKLGLALKESQETGYWLRVIARSKLVSSQRLDDLIDEVAQLCKILGKSKQTARSGRKSSRSCWRSTLTGSQFPVPGSLFFGSPAHAQNEPELAYCAAASAARCVAAASQKLTRSIRVRMPTILPL